jgi:nicotinamidase/pyrazinamidase
MAGFKTPFRKRDGLMIVDVQKDFCPGGLLAIPEGDQIVPVLNHWIDLARVALTPIYVSRDWHPLRHISFQEQGGKWPPHCIQDTSGARFHPALRVPADATKITKGVRFDKDQNSAFYETGLRERLRLDGVERLWIGGLAQDVCVLATALDARALGMDVILIDRATRPVTREGAEEARRKMVRAGVLFFPDLGED